MPLYEYKCVKCGHRFEKIESVSASETKKCPKCGAKAERQLGAPAIQFKGSGWYVTDYAGKSPSGAPKDNGDSGTGAAKSESQPASSAKESSKPPAKKGKEKEK